MDQSEWAWFPSKKQNINKIDNSVEQRSSSKEKRNKANWR